MRKDVFGKGMVLGIIFLFVGAGVIPSISGNQTKETTNIENRNGNDDVVFDQPPFPPENELEEDMYYLTSSKTLNNWRVYENLWDIYIPIGKIVKVVWWGLIWDFAADSPGSPEGIDFSIVVFNDDIDHSNMPPKDKIQSFAAESKDIEIIHTNRYKPGETGYYGELIRFEYYLTKDINLGEGKGWISIQSIVNTNGDSFLWSPSYTGDDYVFQCCHDDPDEDNRNFDVALKLICEDNLPPDKPNRPSGPTRISTGIEYNYTTYTIDPHGEQVQYKWDWGDGIQSTWIGPYDSGETCTASHIYREEGDYEIKVRAIDAHGYQSDWSDPLRVGKFKSRDFNSQFIFYSFFENHPYIFPILRFILGLGVEE